jgi:hypothetical protein
MVQTSQNVPAWQQTRLPEVCVPLEESSRKKKRGPYAVIPSEDRTILRLTTVHQNARSALDCGTTVFTAAAHAASGSQKP